MTITTLTMTGGTLTSDGTVTLGGDVAATSDANGPATIDGDGTLDLGTAARTFTVNDGPGADDLVVDAIIAGGFGLTKAGTGKAVLNNDNTYTGTTTLTAGTLIVNGSVGAVAKIRRHARRQRHRGHAHLDRRHRRSGRHRRHPQRRRHDLRAATTFRVDVNGGAVGTGYDQLNVTGDIDLGGAALTGNLAFPAAINDTFTIIQADYGTITGQFAGGATVFLNGRKFTVAYNPTSVVLTHVIADSTTPDEFGQPVRLRPVDDVHRDGHRRGRRWPPGAHRHFTGRRHRLAVALDGAGVATLTTRTLTVGSHSITADYNGDPELQPRPRPPVTQVVNKADTSTVFVTSTTRPSSARGHLHDHGHPDSPGRRQPDGNVTFRLDGLRPWRTTLVNAGRRSDLIEPALSARQHTITSELQRRRRLQRLDLLPSRTHAGRQQGRRDRALQRPQPGRRSATADLHRHVSRSTAPGSGMPERRPSPSSWTGPTILGTRGRRLTGVSRLHARRPPGGELSRSPPSTSATATSTALTSAATRTIRSSTVRHLDLRSPAIHNSSVFGQSRDLHGHGLTADCPGAGQPVPTATSPSRDGLTILATTRSTP